MNLTHVRADINAAIVGAITTLPQAVAYGLIAFSPLGSEWAVFGITASVGTAVLFGILSGVFGSNPFMLSGPRAVSSLAFAGGLLAALERGYGAEEALLLALFGLVGAGLFELLAGTLRLGNMVSYVPVPVLSGFVNGSAILVFLSAMPMVLGAPDVSLGGIVGSGFSDVSLWALAVGGLSVAVILFGGGRVKFVPPALLGVALAAVVYQGGVAYLSQHEGPLVGYINLSELWRLPVIFTAEINWAQIISDADIPILSGISLGLLNSFDTVLTGRALDFQTDSKSNANKDLKVHGLLNAAMGLLGLLPGSGLASRSNAVLKAGARTRLANIGASVVFGLMVIFLAPLIALLPLWATAGMLVATAVQAIERPVLKKAWSLISGKLPYPRVVAGDVGITLVVVITALMKGLIAAVGMGIALSVVLFVLGMGRNPIRRVYRGSRVHSKTQRPPLQADWLEAVGHCIAVVELQGALFFGSCARLLDEARNLLDQGTEFIILDLKHLTSVDSTGASAVRNLNLLCLEAGGRLFISYVEPERRLPAGGLLRRGDGTGDNRRRDTDSPRWVWLNLEANGIPEVLGEDGFFDDTDHALTYCENILLGRSGRLSRNGSRGVVASSLLFASLNRGEIIDLGRLAARHRFTRGEVVFQQGDSGGRAYFMMSGRMDVLIRIPGTGRQKRVSVLHEGALFGEMGLIDGEKRSASVVASEDGVCYSIDIEAFQALRKRSPDVVATLLLNLSQLFAGRLRMANLMISELEQ